MEKHWTSATVLASHQGQELSLAGRCSCDVPAGGLCWGSKASCPKTCWEAACWGTSKTDQLGAEGARTQAGSLPWGAMQTHREAAHYLGVMDQPPCSGRHIAQEPGKKTLEPGAAASPPALNPQLSLPTKLAIVPRHKKGLYGVQQQGHRARQSRMPGPWRQRVSNWHRGKQTTRGTIRPGEKAGTLLTK